MHVAMQLLLAPTQQFAVHVRRPQLPNKPDDFLGTVTLSLRTDRSSSNAWPAGICSTDRRST